MLFGLPHGTDWPEVYGTGRSGPGILWTTDFLIANLNGEITPEPKDSSSVSVARPISVLVVGKECYLM